MSVASQRLWRWALIGIFVMAFAVRVGAVLLFGLSDIIGNNENTVIANNLAQGNGFTFDFYGARPTAPLRSFMPPLYPAWMSVYFRYFAQPALALELSQAFLSSLTVLLIYYIAVRLSSNRLTGALAAIGIALYPPFVIMSGYPQTVTLNTFLLALYLAMSIWLFNKTGAIRAMLTGSVLGCLVLTRPAAIGLLPCLVIWLWFTASAERRKKILAAGILTAATFITLLPWIVRNYQVQGKLILVSTNGGFNFWLGNNPFTSGNGFEADNRRLAQYVGTPYDPAQPKTVHLMPYVFPDSIQQQVSSIKETDLDQALFQAGLDFLRDNPDHGIELALAKLQGLWWFGPNAGAFYESNWTGYYTIVYAVLLIISLPGIILSLRKWPHYFLVYFLFVYFTVTYVVFNGQVRFRWEIEPYLIIFAAVTLSLALQTIRARSLKPAVR